MEGGMNFIPGLVSIIAGYFIGAIPFGLIIVKLKTGQDVRQMGSGRTGGTNVGRAAGPLAGLATAALDGLKGAVTVWLAMWITGGNHWAEGLAGVAAVIGQIYSIFSAERDEKGRLKFRGGAGGGTSVGVASGLWVWTLFIVAAPGLFAFFAIGYASVTTMTMGLTAIVVFTVRAIFFGGPWEYAVAAGLIFLLQLRALRPNIIRLLDGTERAHSGWGKRRAQRLAAGSGRKV
jgi:glycerol-3-phosphate acyltransferase PlsY